MNSLRPNILSIGRLAVAAAVAAGLAVPATAQADVRHGSVVDPIDNQPSSPSLVPRPTVTEITWVEATYDQQAGAVSLKVSFNESLHESKLGVEFRLMGRVCVGDSGDTTPRLDVWLDPLDEPHVRAELRGYEGSVVSDLQISGDGRSMSTTVAHPAFAGRDWRCVGGNTNEVKSDGFGFFFAGYEPDYLDTRTALSTLRAELTRRYGTRWQAAGTWLKCPPQEYFPDGFVDADTPQALCEFRFREKARWRHGSLVLTEEAGEITTSHFRSFRFVKRMRRCRSLRSLRRDGVFDRQLRAGGWIGCWDNPASMIRDLHTLRPGVRRVGFHGTNRAGFEDAVRFRCVLRARSGHRRLATCANKLGDRFRYRFRLGR